MIYDVSSITNAMRGKSMLERNGIHAMVSRTIDKNGNNGCGYSIIILGDFERAERLLASAGIRIRGRRRVEDAK